MSRYFVKTQKLKMRGIYARNVNAVSAAPQLECNLTRCINNFYSISRENCIAGYHFHHGSGIPYINAILAYLPIVPIFLRTVSF